MGTVRAGAAVRSNSTGKQGRTFRNTLRGYLWVQWDGERDRQTVRIRDVSLVADRYDAAKVWEAAEAAGEVHRVRP
jgi:hypothetical protein